MNKSTEPIECRYCHGLGHSKDKCPKLIYRERKRLLVPNNHNTTVKQQPASTYEIEYPSLSTVINRAQPIKMNFANALNKTETTEDQEVEINPKEVMINGHKMELL